MFGPVIPLQRFGNGVLAGFNAIITVGGSSVWSAFPSHQRAENAQASHSGTITDNVVQMKIHLIQRLLHVLNVCDGPLDQIVAMAEETAELADGLRRSKRRRQQPIRVQLLQPSTSKAIRFRASRDIFDVASIDESNFKAAGFEDVKQRNPVHSGGCHHNGSDTTGR
jgi:hypothetical protein